MRATAAGFLLVLLGLFPKLSMADYQAGLDAYGSGDFDRAFYEWMEVADSAEGDVHPEILAETCYALGMLFWVGQGVQQNTAESAFWLRKAAELNHTGAQVKLGYLYSSGEGVPQSDFEAMKWLMMAARQGDADAQYNLGVLYRDGLGVEADADKSLHWFREAAVNGDPVSAGIVAEWENSVRNSTASRSAPAQQDMQTQRTPVSNAPGPGTSRAPVNPESPWWVDVHGIALDVQEDAADSTSEPPTVDVPPAASELPAIANEDVAEIEESNGRAAGSPPQRESSGAELPAPVEQAATTDEVWLRARDPERFTIQVIALLDLQKLHTFIKRHSDWAPFALYEQEWKGQPLWVLVQGDYADVIEAREAARKFPTDIQKHDKLWIRKFVMVQGQLE